MNTPIRLTAAAAVSALFSLSTGDLQAASVTYNDDTCDVFSGQTVNGVFTVSCMQRKSGTTGTTTGTGTGTTTGTGTGTGTSTNTGTPGNITCSGFTNTHVIPIAWGALQSGSVSVFTKSFGGFSGNDIVVASFTTPGATSSGQVGAIQAAEYASTAISRTAALSTSPCTFDNGLGASGSVFATVTGSALVSGNTVTVSFQVGGSSTWYPVLQPNTTYYFNIKNTKAVGGDMKIELQKPPGL